MRFRRVYDDLFFQVYDRVIALHSGDVSARLLDVLIERTGIKAGGRLLDLWTGTGAVAVRAQTPVEPGRPRIRFLYRVRLSVLRSSENRDFARDEVPFLRRYFAGVRRELSPNGRSKLIVGNKHEGAETPG